MPRPIDPAREEARGRGDTRYLSARTCPHGHIGKRYVINAACSVCADVRRAERLGREYVPAPPKTAKLTAEPVEPTRINRAASLSFAVTAYQNSPEARAHSRHLDRLIRKGPST